MYCVDKPYFPILSICVPTYNRRNLIVGLAKTLLAVEGPLELCVHVDGSTDGTQEALSRLTDSRLKISSSANFGRAIALRRAVRSATGRYIMLFDDDDAVDISQLVELMDRCQQPLPPKIVGFIYHMSNPDGAIIGKKFGAARSNFLELRADRRVTGDKKEVVCRDALRSSFDRYSWSYRRVPTSLYWFTLALDYDVICIEASMGSKVYLKDGMTSKMATIKADNAYPLFALHWNIVKGFLKGRYQSKRYVAKSLAAIPYYLFQNLFVVVRRRLNL
jgi:glycosyltransferase involved in cell wall biosynthesis